MTASLVRAALLLVLVSVVGLVGVNGSLDPTKVQSARAAALDIVLLSDNTGSLVFHVGAQDCPEFLAPGDACTAHVVVDNQGTETAEISQPSASVSGVLNTCTGDDPSNPGVGGPNITLSLQNITYNDAVHLLAPGHSESFDVAFALDLAIGNACQAKSATIVVTLQDGLAPATPTPSPVLETSPPPVQQPQIPQGQQSVAGQPTGPTSEVQRAVTTPGATLVNEVLPSRFPVTGQGWKPQRSTNLLALLFWGTGSAGVLLLAYALLLGRRKRGGQ